MFLYCNKIYKLNPFNLVKSVIYSYIIHALLTKKKTNVNRTNTNIINCVFKRTFFSQYVLLLFDIRLSCLFEIFSKILVKTYTELSKCDKKKKKFFLKKFISCMYNYLILTLYNSFSRWATRPNIIIFNIMNLKEHF